MIRELLPNARVLVVTCCDHEALCESLSLLKTTHNVVALNTDPGGVLCLSVNVPWINRNQFRTKINLELDLKRCDSIVVLHHENCGAYKKFSFKDKRPSVAAEECTHVKHMMHAKKHFQSWFKGVLVTLCYQSDQQLFRVDEDESLLEMVNEELQTA